VAVDCTCGHSWCFNCGESAHLPCGCSLAEKWLSLCRTDAENVTWIRAFTKRCPKCQSMIEKNEGCNHMTCRCGYEFCWLCKQDWKKTGYGHTCNKPQDVQALEDEADKAKHFLQRYMFYFARYEAHEKSASFALKSLQNAEGCVKEFVKSESGRKYSDLQFITLAVIEIIRSRRFLQWSYAYGYYLQDGSPLKLLFENQQGMLESFCDQLHAQAEQRVDKEDLRRQLLDLKVREILINLTRTVAQYRKNLAESLLNADFVYQDGIMKQKSDGK